VALPVELSLQDYWRIIVRRVWLIAFAFVVTVILTGVFTLNQDPVYSSAATLKIEPPAGETGVGGAFANWDPWSGINTELQVIGAASTVELALRRGNIIAPDAPPAKAGAVVGDVLGRLNPKRVGETSLVRVVVEAGNPVEAAAIAQSVAETYVEQDVIIRRKRNQQALENISRRKADIETTLHSLEEDKRRMIEDSPAAMAAGSMAGKLFDLESRKAVLLDRYTDAHPDIKKLSQEIKVLSQKMRMLPRDALEVARVERDIRVNENLYTALARQYEEQRVASASVLGLGSVVSKATANPVPIRPNRMANMLFGGALGMVIGLMLAFLAENLDTSLVTVDDVEKTLEMPVLGLIPHIITPGGRDRGSLIARLLPHKRDTLEIRRERLIIKQAPHSPAVEAYHSLRTSLEGSFPGKEKGRNVVFTSCGMSEGKTLSCVNFALAAIQVGQRVLLIDGDLRRPSIHRLLGVPNDIGLTDLVIGGRAPEECIKGVTDIMAGTARIEDLLHTEGIDNLSLVTGGGLKANPVDVFKRDEFDRVMAVLRPRYDWIIIDCPPLLLFADGLLLGPKADGVVIFYQFGRMARSVLKRAKDELLTVKARPLGIVINDVRPKELEPRYGYYRSAYYYDRYGEEDGEEGEDAET